MPVYWEESACGLQEDDFATKVENVYNVTQKPHMQGNERTNGRSSGQ